MFPNSILISSQVETGDNSFIVGCVRTLLLLYDIAHASVHDVHSDADCVVDGVHDRRSG